MTDARLLARHLSWASTTSAARDQTFNIVNGDIFRWRWMWQRIATWFALQPALFAGEGVPLEKQLGGAVPELTTLISPWHTDDVKANKLVETAGIALPYGIENT